MEDAKKFYELDTKAQSLKNFAEKTLVEHITTYDFTTLLEIGSGDGHMLNYFAGKQAMGYDYNQSMLAAAKAAGNNVRYGDITGTLKEQKRFDIICSNYVFSEHTEKQLQQAFANIERLLEPTGTFLFTMTDPRTRDKDFPGCKLVFNEPFAYEKRDLPFTVLLQEKTGAYVDVGIRDVHRPLEDYDMLLQQAGFAFTREDITMNLPDSFAILYIATKTI